MASLPKEEIEVDVPPPKGSKVAKAAKKKITPIGPPNSRIKPVNSTSAVTPVTPSVPSSIPGSTATTTVPLPHSQHNSIHPVIEIFDYLKACKI